MKYSGVVSTLASLVAALSLTSCSVLLIHGEYKPKRDDSKIDLCGDGSSPSAVKIEKDGAAMVVVVKHTRRNGMLTGPPLVPFIAWDLLSGRLDIEVFSQSATPLRKEDFSDWRIQTPDSTLNADFVSISPEGGSFKNFSYLQSATLTFDRGNQPRGDFVLKGTQGSSPQISFEIPYSIKSHVHYRPIVFGNFDPGDPVCAPVLKKTEAPTNP